MAATSYWQFYRKMPDDAAGNATDLSDGYPVSAGRAFDLRSNLRHLDDMFVQHRINWCATTEPGGGNGILYVDMVAGSIYEQEFELSWLGPDHPANLDLLIRSYASGTSAAMDVRARVVPWYTALEDLSGPAVVDETVSVSTTTGELDHQEYFDPADTTTMEILRSAIVGVEPGIPDADGNWTSPQICRMRLQVHLLPTAGTGTLVFLLTGVTVREFA